MPFERSREELNKLIDKAVAEDQQIREGLEEGGYEGPEIHDELATQIGNIWEVALEEIRNFNFLEIKVREVEKAVSDEVGEPPAKGSAKMENDWMAGIAVLYVLGLIVWGFIKLARGKWTLGSPEEWIAYLVNGIIAAIWIAITFALAKWQASRNRSDSQQQQKKLQDWQKRRDEAAARHGTATLQSELTALEVTIGQLLFERVRQMIVAAINRRLAQSYAPILDIKRPRGFGEVFDKRFTIQTPARKRLQFMLNNMPGGSIGIAGSRGAGKTTLLKLFCGPKRVIEALNGKPILGVLVSAPVAYQARDFILYLFSALCQNVIEAEGGKYRFPSVPADAPPSEVVDAPAFVALKPIPSILLRIGVSLVLVSILLSGVAALHGTVKPGMAPQVAPASRTQPVTTAPQGKGAQSQPVQSRLSSQLQQSQAPSKGGRQSSAPVNIDGNLLLSQWAAGLKIDFGAMLWWGTWLFVSGLMLAEFLCLGAWRTFVLAMVRLFRSTIGLIPPWNRIADRWLHIQFERADDERRLRRPPSESPQTVPPDDSLWANAETWLRTIKFQQSFTSGWSGALKLPIGLESGVSRAVTLAQNQLSLPEVVYFLTRFLEQVSLKYQVIIGIDEMDKLASDDLAQQFLNDIKSIFGLEHCFYLISVSESAMSNFERRGLPFRDVFDSAFDDFVYVDHLNFESARELLEQRVVGRPIPFFGLSYCMSGGLARDLIRNFRSVLEAYEPAPPGNGLATICQKVVESDLLAKVRATRTSAQKIKIEPELDNFLESLYKIEVDVRSDDLLIRAAQELLAMVASSQPGKLNTAKDATEVEKGSKLDELLDLADELATYLYYAVTLRQFFNDNLQQMMLIQVSDGHLDTLAKARQVLGINPSITRSLLRSFRAAHGLPAFS